MNYRMTFILTTGGSGSGDGDIISSSQELRHGRGVIGEEYTLPGQASGERIGAGTCCILRTIFMNQKIS